MKLVSSILLYCMPFLALAQNFPTDSRVLEDVKKYHGKIATARVQNEWKLEKEAGYTFSNMAKRVVAATTTKENDVYKDIIGLAIYVRGGAGEPWRFSRYFVTSSETHGQKQLTEAQIIEQTTEHLRKNPNRIFGDLSAVAWIYGISFPNGFVFEDQKDGDYIYKAMIDYERKEVESIPFDGGLYRYKAPLDIYVRQIDGVLQVGGFSMLNSMYVQKTAMSEKQFNACPSLRDKPYDEISGPQGPAVNSKSEKQGSPQNSDTGATGEQKKTDNTGHTGEGKKVSKLPKIKIGF